MIINNVKLVLENAVHWKYRMAKFAPLPKARAASRKRWTAKVAGYCPD